MFVRFSSLKDGYGDEDKTTKVETAFYCEYDMCSMVLGMMNESE